MLTIKCSQEAEAERKKSRLAGQRATQQSMFGTAGSVSGPDIEMGD